jgi:uncharacterized protein DUF1360
MPTWLLYLLIALAVHRLTRLTTRDKFPLISLPRYYVTNWLDPSTEYIQTYQKKHPDRPAPQAHWGIIGSSLAYLWECDWCVSVWVSAALVTGLTHFISVPMPFLIWLAASTVTGLIASHEPD